MLCLTHKKQVLIDQEQTYVNLRVSHTSRLDGSKPELMMMTRFFSGLLDLDLEFLCHSHLQYGPIEI